MASEVELLNIALSSVGALPITGIDDGSINANHCTRLYPALRNAWQRIHYWNFNEARVELAQEVVAPPLEFAYQYALPGDFLRLRSYCGVAGVWLWAWDFPLMNSFYYKLVADKKLLTNDSQAFIIYSKLETNPDLWDPLFYLALANLLAGQLALAIPKDTKKSAGLVQLGTAQMNEAMSVDGQENPVFPIESNSLIWGR